MSYDNNNIFARILRGELTCNKVYEDEFALAFNDIYPKAPTHILVIPKGAYISFNDFMLNADEQMVAGFFKAVQKTANMLGVVESGYRIVSNHGSNADQTVPHFHVHIIGGKRLGAMA
jgi:histidine triad (HIT) family protein